MKTIAKKGDVPWYVVALLLALVVFFISTVAFGGSFGKSMKSLFGIQKGLDDCDSDGISNQLDDCPYKEGDKAYNGCTFEDSTLTAAQKKGLCVQQTEDCKCPES